MIYERELALSWLLVIPGIDVYVRSDILNAKTAELQLPSASVQVPGILVELQLQRYDLSSPQFPAGPSI